MFKQNYKETGFIFLLTLVIGFLLIYLYANEFLSTAFVTADTETVPFLRSPYYENPSITSFMDHKFPTYNSDPNDDFPEMVRFDGQTWSQAPVSTCEQGVNCYDGHDGSDFANGLPFQVLAAAEGTIVFADWFNVNDHSAGFGMLVDIDHGNGYRTQYGHLSAITRGVDPPAPQPVNAGDQIGTVGETGNVSGKHLHFTVLRNGVEVDPYGWSPANPTTTPDPWQDYAGVESAWLWEAGAQVGSPFPPPDIGVAQLIRVVDNGFSFGCTTSPSCPLWFYYPGTSSFPSVWYTCVNDDVGDYWAEWTPSITISGNYEVLVGIPPYPELAKGNPRYTIHYLDGSVTNTVLLDQPTTADNYWISLGAYYFEAESNAMLHITNATGESNPTTCTGNPQEDILFLAGNVVFRQLLPPLSAQTFMPRILKGDSVQAIQSYPGPATPTPYAYAYP